MDPSRKWNVPTVQIDRPPGLKHSFEVRMKEARYSIAAPSAAIGMKFTFDIAGLER